jgi:hypothetical protein
MKEKTPNNNMTSTTMATILFLGTSFLFAKSKKRRRNSSPNHDDVMTKEQVMNLRSKHFSKRVSVSYANSGPLMIVGVS